LRTLTGVSRLFLLAAIAVAALLVLGGAYFIGYVGQLQRELSGPQGLPERSATQIAIVERALGHAGFLRSYRDYWLGDAQAKPELIKRADEATRATKELVRLDAGRAEASAAGEIAAVVSAFAQTAAIAPATPPSGLRGVPDDGLKALPSPAQLETTYLSLAVSIERLRDVERASSLQAVGVMLDRSQVIVGIALAALICGLALVAWLMRSRVIHPLNILERSLSAAAEGSLGPRIWGTDRSDEIGELARAGEALRRGLAELPALKSLAEKGQVHVTLEGPGAILFDKVAAQASAAADALQIAAGKASATQRIELNTAIAQLGQACNDVRAVATSLRGDFSQIIETVTEGAHKVDEFAGRFASGSDELGLIASRANERIGAMLAELSATAQGLRQASEASDATEVNEGMRAAITADLKAIADTVNGAADKVRDEVTRLIQHLSEERLLPLREGVVPVALLEGPRVSTTAAKSLADVPKAEVLERLGNLAAEMQAAAKAGPRPDEIKAALTDLADEMRQLGNAPVTRRASDELSVTLSRHADLIEAHVAAPTEETLRDALDAMARELRQVTARARSSSSSDAALQAANAAAEIEERAQQLFAQLETAMGEDDSETSFEATSADVETLASLAAKLEARADALSEQAVARRFDEVSKAGSPAELREKAFAADMRTDSAIQTVFEAIERLNNVAAALARAGDAERQRRIAG
jgi:methyl-accepting chemotaxis protein